MTTTKQTETLEPARDGITKLTKTINRIFERYDREELWKTCPACGEEWTKLFGCKVAGGWSYVCVECAETLKSLEWIVMTYRVEPPFDNWPPDWIRVETFYPKGLPSFLTIGKEEKAENVPLIRNKQGIIKIWLGAPHGEPSATWFLRAESTGISLSGKNGFIAKYANSLDAWFDISNRAREWAKQSDGAEKEVQQVLKSMNFRKKR